MLNICKPKVWIHAVAFQRFRVAEISTGFMHPLSFCNLNAMSISDDELICRDNREKTTCFLVSKNLIVNKKACYTVYCRIFIAKKNEKKKTVRWQRKVKKRNKVAENAINAFAVV